MKHQFDFETSPSRIVFGSGRRRDIQAEITRAGVSRALVLSTPHQTAQAEEICEYLGERAVATFSEAAMHTPLDVTEKAMKAFADADADCVIAIGGGSTTGLSKAIAYRNNVTQLVIPTTYAGSEVTPILGQTAGGVKTTVREVTILPDVVIYDPDLTLGLPVHTSVCSGLNAIAHAVEGLYSNDRNPISSMMAVEGIRALKSALPKIVQSPEDAEGRAEALYGAWLCGTVLGSVGMALHHKLCHTLGGSFDLPHAEIHAILLPHTAAFNGAAAADELSLAAALFDGNLGGGLYQFAKDLGAPMSLSEFGLNQSDVGRAAELATKHPYWNPREISRDGIQSLLSNAVDGKPPVSVI